MAKLKPKRDPQEQTCPVCGSLNVIVVEERDQIICKDCGVVFEPLTPAAKSEYISGFASEVEPKTTLHLGSKAEELLTKAEPEPVPIPKKKIVKKAKVSKKKVAKKKVTKKKTQKKTKKTSKKAGKVLRKLARKILKKVGKKRRR